MSTKPMTPTQRVEQLWSDPGHEGGRQVFLDLARELAAELEQAQSRIEDTLAAFGFHPDSNTDIAEEVHRVRQEGRDHFHALTRAQAELEQAQAENKRALVIIEDQNAEMLEQARLLGKSGSREAALLADLGRAKAECAKLEQELQAIRAARCTNLMERDAALAECESLRKRCAELEKEVLDECEDRARSSCFTRLVEKDYNGQVAGTNVTDSGAISSDAADLRRLAEAGRFRIVSEVGRMVVGYWPENDPQRAAMTANGEKE